MASTIPDFLTRYLPRMEFRDIHYVLVGVERFELSIPKARDFKSLAYTNSATRPFLTFCIYYTLKFPESQNFNVSHSKTSQPMDAQLSRVGFQIWVRAHHISHKFTNEFLEDRNPQITEGLSRPPTVATYTGTAEFICFVARVVAYSAPICACKVSRNYFSLNLTYILYTKFFKNSNFTHHTHASFLP